MPDSLILGSVAKNYSRAVQGAGYVVDTTVTIGYDTPWRQVHALLTEAARRTPFKIVAVGGQVLTTNLHHETYARYFAAERDTILARIERENIKGVVFLTGDRHFTELSSLTNARGNVLYDLTASPITSGVYADAAKEANQHRVEGTLVTQHNFAMLRFSGPRTKRQLDITVYDGNGKELWTRNIPTP